MRENENCVSFILLALPRLVCEMVECRNFCGQPTRKASKRRETRVLSASRVGISRDFGSDMLMDKLKSWRATRWCFSLAKRMYIKIAASSIAARLDSRSLALSRHACDVIVVNSRRRITRDSRLARFLFIAHWRDGWPFLFLSKREWLWQLHTFQRQNDQFISFYNFWNFILLINNWSINFIFYVIFLKIFSIQLCTIYFRCAFNRYFCILAHLEAQEYYWNVC